MNQSSKNEIYKFFDILRSWIFPDRCVLCNKVVPYNTEVCAECLKKATVVSGEKCKNCGFPKNLCSCLGKSFYFDGVTAPFLYKGNVRQGISYWKFGGAVRNTGFYAKTIKNSVKRDFKDIEFDFVSCVPQTENETKERGYNQGELLAEMTAEKLKIPFKNALIKLFDTERQHNVPKEMKTGNVFGAFDVKDRRAVNGSSILLVDDIKTSGNTLNECAKMLKLYGAKEVYCAVIALA